MNWELDLYLRVQSPAIWGELGTVYEELDLPVIHCRNPSEHSDGHKPISTGTRLTSFNASIRHLALIVSQDMFSWWNLVRVFERLVPLSNPKAVLMNAGLIPRSDDVRCFAQWVSHRSTNPMQGIDMGRFRARDDDYPIPRRGVIRGEGNPCRYCHARPQVKVLALALDWTLLYKGLLAAEIWSQQSSTEKETYRKWAIIRICGKVVAAKWTANLACFSEMYRTWGIWDIQIWPQ